jgi:hypothetical protein
MGGHVWRAGAHAGGSAGRRPAGNGVYKAPLRAMKGCAVADAAANAATGICRHYLHYRGHLFFSAARSGFRSDGLWC